MRLVLAFMLLGAIAQAAPANPERARAKALFDSGTTHYNLSEFADALKDFKEAYRLVKDPILLFNIAQCQRQLKEYEEAARLLRAYRREYPNAPNREEVDRLITQMDDAIAEQRNRQPPTGTMQPQPSAAPEHIEAPPVAMPAITPTTVTATPSEKSPAKKKTWIWGVVGAVAAVVVAGVVVGAVLGTEKTDLPQKLPDVHF